MSKILAELNIAKTIAPMDSPGLKEFVDNLDYINGIAEQSDGFIWRLKDDTGNATQITVFDDPNIIVNMSTWRNVEALKNFMFKSDHINFFKRKAQWFEKPVQATYVLWWIEQHQQPTIEQALQKLDMLRTHGETAEAFSFKKIFEATE